MTSSQKASLSMKIASDPLGTPHVAALVDGGRFRLQFARGAGITYPIHRLPHYRRFYRRMSRLHPHPSYKAIADALDQLTENL
ncbi:hypothetical protein SAMN05444339_11818 [Loktanella atrilutea]|uniref:Uncharacterized protein n=1 Tax=Loktanella atrilutea TaxID=366533 RepID=A0A1M5F8R7_LOKAT|nr:hypothetical protein [Loktanella atrilutea]SHF88010.1 hypothetical protein SAMN05444339_11818 [Loktanella atrilutea]